jgi:hypothetical protein
MRAMIVKLQRVYSTGKLRLAGLEKKYSTMLRKFDLKQARSFDCGSARRCCKHGLVGSPSLRMTEFVT